MMKRNARSKTLSPPPPSPKRSCYEAVHPVESNGMDVSKHVVLPPNPIPYPINLSTLPPNIIETILRHLLPYQQTIRPTHAFCSLINGLRIDSEAPDDGNLSLIPNVDASLFYVCQSFATAGSTILYSENHFVLRDSSIATWWTKRIGARNLAKLSYLTLRMHSGWSIPLKDRQFCDSSFEQDWFRVLCRLKPVHTLIKLQIVMVKWGNLMNGRERRDANLVLEEAQELMKVRHKIVGELEEFRGVEHAEIDQVGLPYMNAREIGHLSLLMQQRQLGD